MTGRRKKSNFGKNGIVPPDGKNKRSNLADRKPPINKAYISPQTNIGSLA